MLALQEALDSEQVAAREMVVELDQPGVPGPVRLLGPPFKLSRTPAQPTSAPGPALGQHTEEVLREAGYSDEAIGAMLAVGRGRRPGRGHGSFLAP